MIIAFLFLRNKAKGAQPPRLLNTSTDTSAVNRLFRIDWLASALFVIGGILLLLGLNWGANQVWNTAKVIVCLVLGAILLIGTLAWEFVLEEKQYRFINAEIVEAAEEGESPKRLGRFFVADAMIPLAVLKNYDVCATQFAAFTSGMVMLVIFYFVAIFMVIVNGLNAVQAGVQLIYFAPGMVSHLYSRV